jgi:hypothetical protein
MESAANKWGNVLHLFLPQAMELCIFLGFKWSPSSHTALLVRRLVGSTGYRHRSYGGIFPGNAVTCPRHIHRYYLGVGTGPG